MIRLTIEETLHKAVAGYLAAVLKPEVLWFHTPNGEHRSPVTAKKLKDMGVRAGVFDFMIGWSETQLPGGSPWIIPRVGWIEMKKPGETLSPAQFSFAAVITQHGHYYAACTSIAEVEGTILAWHVPNYLSRYGKNRLAEAVTSP